MSANAQRFAQEVLDAFRRAKRFTVEEVVAAGGPSTSTMTKLRKAAEGKPMEGLRGDTMRRIETAAGWPEGSATVLWETGRLPDNDTARAIGTGGTPAPEVFIHSSTSSIEAPVDGGEIVYTTTTTATDRAGHESRLEIRYTPGAGRELTLMDLGPVASRAHHDAARVTYLEGTRAARRNDDEGGGAHAGGAAPNTPADSGPPLLAVASGDEGDEKLAREATEQARRARAEQMDAIAEMKRKKKDRDEGGDGN